jgi:hypothetical protein
LVRNNSFFWSRNLWNGAPIFRTVSCAAIRR